MRIALFHNLPSGGAKRAVFEWVSRLAGKNEIHVYTLSTADHVFCDIRPFSQTHTILEFTPRKLLRSPFGRLNQFQRWRDLRDMERINRQIAEQINAGRYDILFANPSIFTLIPPLLNYVTIPSVYYLHEPFGSRIVRGVGAESLFTRSWQEKFDRFDPLIWLYENQLAKMRRRSILKANLLLSNSEFTRENIQNNYAVDAPVCYLGVNFNDFQPIPDMARDDFVLSVGELSARKGFDFVIESLGRIPADERPPLKIACNAIIHQEKKHVENLARRTGIELEILFGLHTDELRSLYNKAKLFVYAPVLEPFGVVPLEAMACETAVVAVREGGVMESIVHEHTGLLINRDSQEFGSAILHLLKNPLLAAEYGKNGRRHVLENWTWEKSTGELEQYLLKVAG